MASRFWACTLRPTSRRMWISPHGVNRKTAKPMPQCGSRDPHCSGFLRRAAHVHVKAEQALSGRHEQPVVVLSPEADIGASFRQVDMPQGDALVIEYTHLVELFAAHARSEENTSEL